MRILIDTNIILDIMQKREPFFTDSYRVLRGAIESDTECLISASSATDIFYMLRKSLGSAQAAKDQLEQLAQLVTFADVQGMDIHTALMRAMPDFEDAVVDAVAERSGASYIVTRNIKDFAGSVVPAILPADFLKK
jgi:predicted nucleic acid-binding protein